MRRGLEKYDRGQGVWRGTGKVIAIEQLGAEADWRAALSAVTDLPRDVEGWHAAVVLELGADTARLGIEGKVDQEPVIPAEDVSWARKRLADGKLSKKAKVPSDLLAVGDVVMVRAITNDADDSFKRWS